MNIKDYLPMSLPDGDYAIFGYTPMCGTCKMAERLLDIAVQIRPLPVVKIDLNFVPDFTQAYQLMSVPVLMIIKDESVVETVYRFESVTNIYEIINKALTE